MKLNRDMFVGGGSLIWLASLFIAVAPPARAETITPSWSKTIAGGLSRHFDGRSVAMDSGGDIYVAGFTTSPAGTAWSVMKMSGSGAPIWATSYDGYPNSSNNTAAAYGVALDGSGNAIVVGMEKTAVSLEDWLVRKYSPSGSLVWSESYNSEANNSDIAYGVAVNSSGEIAVVGSEFRGDIGEGYNWLVRKYNSSGILQWSRSYNNPETANGADSASGCSFDRNGNLFVAGYTDNQDSGTGFDMMVVKYDASGNVAWSRTYGRLTNDNEQATAVGADADGNCLVAVSADNNITTPTTGTDWLIIKYDGSGNQLWASPYSGPSPDSNAGGTGGVDVPTSMVVDSRGNAVVAGREEYTDTANVIFEHNNSRILIFSPGGAIISGTSYNDNYGWNEGFMGVACNLWGDVVAVGNMDWPSLDTAPQWKRNLFLAGYHRSGWPAKPAPTAPPPVTGDARLNRNAFSPNRGQTLSVFVKANSASDVSIRVFTPSGRLIAKLEGVKPEVDGWREVVWDGNNSDGQQVSRGVCLINVMSEGFNRTLKVVIR